MEKCKSSATKEPEYQGEHNNTVKITTVLEEKRVVFIPLAKISEHKGHISPSSFYRQLPEGQVDFPELLETPEMMENFMKVTKYLTKFKEILINYGWEKSHIRKQ